jgi:hypothetical protein
MRKILIAFVFLGLIFGAGHVEARSGCCSHHGGVQSSGCGCNDGTPLSATCAPYYSCEAYKPEPVVISCPTHATNLGSGNCSCDANYEWDTTHSLCLEIRKVEIVTPIITPVGEVKAEIPVIKEELNNKDIQDEIKKDMPNKSKFMISTSSDRKIATGTVATNTRALKEVAKRQSFWERLKSWLSF